MNQQITVIKNWLAKHWRPLAIYGALGLLLFVILVQFSYSGSKLLPFTKVDGIDVGGSGKAAVVKLLDEKYAEQKLNIYLGDSKTPRFTPKFEEVGIKVSNKSRLEAMSYPVLLRFVPSSTLWASAVVKPGEPDVQVDSTKRDQYIKKEFGDSCVIAATNASLKVSGDKLQVAPGVPGGNCEISKVMSAIDQFKPTITRENSIRIALKEVAPEINDAAAKTLADKLMARLETGIAIKTTNATVNVPASEVMYWLDFVAVDGKLTPKMNGVRAASYLSTTVAPGVAVAPGTTKISTLDYVETEHIDGSGGQTLNHSATLAAVLAYINGESNEIVAKAAPVPPNIEYNRSYSAADQAMLSMIERYAKDTKGTLGVSVVELSGQRRHAGYNDTRQFTTASTYKLFVAYGTLKRIEMGTFSWSDEIDSGRDLAKCFDDMIVKSDNECGEALLTKIGYREITNEMKALGLNNTTFTSGNTPLTTSGDLAIFLATLESGQMLSADSRGRLLDAMKRNIFREGVPAGVKAGQVADKVGFLDNLYHDAAIVYSPSGTYVVTVMTEDSSWRAISILAGKIEKFRST